MAFASFFRRRSNSRRPASPQSQLEQATKPVLEGLELRLMLSTHRHRTTLAPAERISGASIGTGAYSATRATELRQLYGVSTLTGQNQAFPFFTGQGAGQSIVIIGSVPSYINNVPNGRTGNLSLWSTEQGVGGVTGVNLDPLPIASSPIRSPIVNNYDPVGDQLTTGEIEWAHAMAPLAEITCIECPTSNGIIDVNTLSVAIQEAVRVNQLRSSPGPINGIIPGGVVMLGVSSAGEDATTAAMFDSLFSYKYAAGDTFIAPAGDFGGIPSMPASSPWVTSVGGTDWQTIAPAAGGTTGPITRSFEIADLNSGGGLSTIEPVPAFQRGLTAAGRRLTSRGAVDLAMAEMTPANTGGDTYWDPTVDNSAPNKHYEIVGTAIPAAMFAGMAADVNELRLMSGLGPIGRDMNNELYAVHRTTPNAFFDITSGHNTLYQAAPGYDLATGLGAPQADVLIPALAGIVTQNSAASVVGNFFLANNGNNTGIGQFNNLVVPMRGTTQVVIGNQFISIGANGGGAAQLATGSLTTTSGSGETQVTTTTPVTATLIVNGLITRNLNNTVSGTGTVNVNGEVLPVSITGKVSVSRRRPPHITLEIRTVNSRGKPVAFGLQDVFQATITA